jgi:hypothetical protein
LAIGALATAALWIGASSKPAAASVADPARSERRENRLMGILLFWDLGMREVWRRPGSAKDCTLGRQAPPAFFREFSAGNQ